MKYILLLLSLSVTSLYALAQSTRPTSSTLDSPAQFLGYKIGERFTPHYRVLAYAEQLTRQLPDRVKLIPYGTTFEGRQLMVVALGSEANITRLEEIRTNNLKRIGLLDGTPTAAPQPPITWLSYNVHGNEAVSSEAFMEVLHRLLNPADALSQKILNTAVVILDPGLNPDGHDRYVNWYNQMLGRHADPTPSAREHQEPWPGGRYTHYLFDPNRDWAWQTQEITQQRMALYQQWMPHLHGDFHEMGVESPYYFAPSAKPYHEDITPFQRKFQQIIGQYCSRYFDRNGWLYYTRERFDLFYPSYGDTYPTYNGAIGMTYEQGGSGRAGLAIEKADGDTLTLRQRIDHHVTASMATLESVADRPTEIVKEFGQFFDKSRNTPIGIYKSYVIKSNGDAGRLKALQQLLERNKIRFGLAGKAQTIPGYNYTTQKNEKSVSVAADDIVISAYQSKSTLLKILFEQNSALEDSATYDITAWSLPYAFGLQTYGLTTRLNAGSTQPVTPTTPNTTSVAEQPYAYVIRWQSLPAAQMLAGLLKQKIRVRAAEKSFELENKTYPSGTLIVPRTGNERFGDRLNALVRAEAARTGAEVTPVQTGFVTSGSDFGSDFVTGLKAPRVGLVIGDGTPPPSAGEVWHFFDQELNYPITLLDGNTLGTVEWNKLDVLVLPTNYNYSRFLTDRIMTAIKEWVRAGGKLIAMERAAAFLAGKDGFGLKEKEPSTDTAVDRAKKGNPADSLKIYGDRERTAISDDIPGSIYRVNIDTSHPLGFGLTGGYYTIIQNAYNFDFLKDGWNVGYLKTDNYVAGFSGRNAKAKLKNTLLMGVQSSGRGSIVYLADDPLFRGFWYNGKLLFSNAVFMVGN